MDAAFPATLSFWRVAMFVFRKLINNTPPSGFRWRVFKGTKAVKSGTAKSQVEANAAADRAIAELEAEAAPGATKK